ncbi:RDD family protein [Cryobacterium sp. CG_9.6]|uniref:RDD family protein n=1 Tax=Cryobacterium sp. CG_9.6 TaxID=2760710 RepID=UPI002475857A|nr:RDD family protein [Cryobacterium sp. CG_9.6]MDH6235987.1 putative RDD family membrane protein YckC [Cryobacterium sp. CG_9.6]
MVQRPQSTEPFGDRDEPSTEDLLTGEAVALDVRPANLILRGAGTAIDIAAYGILFLLVIFSAFTLLGGSPDAALAQAVVIASVVFSIVIAPMVVETATHGRSLGKLAIGARIVRMDGGAISLRHAFIRSLTGILEIYLTLGGLAATVGLLNARSQRMGDLLAGTYSQHERVPVYAPPVVGVPLPLLPWSQTVDVARLPDALARRVAQFLQQSAKLTPTTRERLAVSLAAEVAPFVSPRADAPAEAFLVGVAAVRRDREYAALLLEKERLDRLSPVLHGLPHDFPNR